MEVGLNQGHVVIQVKLNFITFINPHSQEIIKVLIYLNGLTMQSDESALAFHHTMTYKEWFYYIFNKQTDTIKRTFIFNMPGPVADMLEAKFKIEGITKLFNFS